MRRVALLPAFVTISWIIFSGIACAHAHLEAARPPINGTVKTAPTELDLKFSEELNLQFTGVRVTGPNDVEIPTSNAVLTDGDKTLTVNLPAGLQAGTYKVEWQALSRDGHKTQGNYTFTVKP